MNVRIFFIKIYRRRYNNNKKTVYGQRWKKRKIARDLLRRRLPRAYCFVDDPVVTRCTQLEQRWLRRYCDDDGAGDGTFKGADGARGTEAVAAAVDRRERRPRVLRDRATPCRGGRRRHPSVPAARHWCDARPANVLPPRLLPKILAADDPAGSHPRRRRCRCFCRCRCFRCRCCCRCRCRALCGAHTYTPRTNAPTLPLSIYARHIIYTCSFSARFYFHSSCAGIPYIKRIAAPLFTVKTALRFHTGQNTSDSTLPPCTRLFDMNYSSPSSLFWPHTK